MANKIEKTHEISIHAPRTGSDYIHLIVPHTIDEFQSTLPARGATMFLLLTGNLLKFQSTLPARGATQRDYHGALDIVFQSTLPARGATLKLGFPALRRIFQSTLPARGATQAKRITSTSAENFNPRSPHGERRLSTEILHSDKAISIHAPRTGSDVFGSNFLLQISIFQSTLPARGATKNYDILKSAIGFQSTLPARGATPRRMFFRKSFAHFNPRSPHGERRTDVLASFWGLLFQSTLPARGATVSGAMEDADGEISIHAPRTGSDESPDKVGRGLEMISIHAPRTGSDHTARAVRRRPIGHFNPRSPHGERRGFSRMSGANRAFQSTLPARGATLLQESHLPIRRFQSTLPARGATRKLLATLSARSHFNPRSPHGERLPSARLLLPPSSISIHAPRTGSDDRTPYPACLCKLFQSTLPARGATYKAYGTPQEVSIFQSTLPARGATLRLFLLRICVIYFNPRSPHGERHQ